MLHQFYIMTQDKIFMRNIDILVTAFLIVFKFTIAQEISWWLVFTPMIISFVIGFVKGYNDGQQDRYKE